MANSLRLRAKLIHKFDILAQRLHDGPDKAAEAEACQVLLGVAVHAHRETLEVMMRAIIKVLDEMQPTIDEAGWNWCNRYDTE